MRYVELRSRVYRLVCLVKVREGAFDPTIREFAITDAGIVVGHPFQGVEAVLSGTVREAAAAATAPSEDSGQGSPDYDTGRSG